MNLTIDEIITILMKLSPSNKTEDAIAEKLKDALRKLVGEHTFNVAPCNDKCKPPAGGTG